MTGCADVGAGCAAGCEVGGFGDVKLLPGLKVEAVGLKEKVDAFGFKDSLLGAVLFGAAGGCRGGATSASSSQESAMHGSAVLRGTYRSWARALRAA